MKHLRVSGKGRQGATGPEAGSMGKKVLTVLVLSMLALGVAVPLGTGARFVPAASAQIPDGTSNTVLVSEVIIGLVEGQSIVISLTPGKSDCEDRISRASRGGASFLFLDGSVRFFDSEGQTLFESFLRAPLHGFDATQVGYRDLFPNADGSRFQVGVSVEIPCRQGGEGATPTTTIELVGPDGGTEALILPAVQQAREARTRG